MLTKQFKIADADTHVTPLSDLLENYMSSVERDRLTPFHKFRIEAGIFHREGNASEKAFHYEYSFNTRRYLRRLGDAEPLDPQAKDSLPFQSSRHSQEPSFLLEDDPRERIKDMNLEHVDVNFMLQSGRFGIWTSQPDIEIENTWYLAYHRWMEDYCSAFPGRLTGVLICSGRDVESAVKQIHMWSGSSWAKGIFVYAPEGEPLDAPKLEPIWAAAAESNLAVVLHTFTADPPYAPGGRDTWDNLWIQRSAAHPWCGMRNMAGIIGAGIMDRYVDLRVGVLEAGHGWLPFWVNRLDEHADMVKNALPPLKGKPSDYVTGGRYFQSIEMSEGVEVTQSVIDLLGDHILMFASDYPHGESWFPESTKTVLKWDMHGESTLKKLMWDNAARLYNL